MPVEQYGLVVPQGHLQAVPAQQYQGVQPPMPGVMQYGPVTQYAPPMPALSMMQSVSSVQSMSAQSSLHSITQFPSHSPIADGASPQLTWVVSPQLPLSPIQLESPVSTPAASTSNSPDATALPQLEATNVSRGQYLDINGVSHVPSSTPDRSRSSSPYRAQSRRRTKKPRQRLHHEPKGGYKVPKNKMGVPDYAWLHFDLEMLQGIELEKELSSITREFHDLDEAKKKELLKHCESGESVYYASVKASKDFQITKQMIGKDGQWLKKTTTKQDLLFLWYSEKHNRFYVFGKQKKLTVFALRNLVSWKMWYECGRDEEKYFVRMEKAQNLCKRNW